MNVRMLLQQFDDMLSPTLTSGFSVTCLDTLTAISLGGSQLGFQPDYGKRRRRPAARQSRDRDSPARSGAYAASLRDTNSVKSRTRFVLRVSPV